MDELTSLVAEKTKISASAVSNILTLISDGATIPFIARYRKEATGGASEEQLRAFEEAYAFSNRLLERKADILRLIEERGRLDPDIRSKVQAAKTMTELEDLYRPYKEKRSTRAGQALARGLESLADILQKASLSAEELQTRAMDFVGKEVADGEKALQGALDIIAERFSDDPRERKMLREQMRRQGVLEITKGKEFDPQAGYAAHVHAREKISSIPFRDDVRDIEALKEGDVVSGVVRSIVDFGAFVDIGLKNDGLIHISELSTQRIAHPMEVLSVNQYLPRIRVLRVDMDKGRVSLSIPKGSEM
ncbi:MAG: Tex-like N-terminal domain-containing protein [Desulfovermiculus sp.]